MAQSYTYSGNVYAAVAGGTTTFPLTSTAGNPIGYLQRAHIHVYLSGDDGNTWAEQARPSAWDFNAEGTSVVLVSGITAGQWVRVLRITPLDNRFVDFANGSLLTADQLDVAEDYSRYCDQELADGVASTSEDVAEAPDDGVLYGRQSKTWQPVPDPGIEEAPNNGSLYGRQSETWLVVPDPGIEEAPIDSKEYVRVNQSWKEIPEDQTGVPEAPINTKTFARKDASWVEISAEGGINYKGTRDLTLAAPVAIAGDFYVNTATSGTVANSWTGIAGDVLEGAERVVYNGSTWEMLPMPPAPAGVVEEVVAGNDITVNSGNPARPVVSVKDGVFLKSFEVKAGTNITVVGGDTVSVTNNSFLPYDISTLAALPTP